MDNFVLRLSLSPFQLESRVFVLVAGFYFRVQECRSGENTRLSPMWPGVDYQTRRHMWVELLVFYCGPRGFLRLLKFSPQLKKKNILFELICVNC